MPFQHLPADDISRLYQAAVDLGLSREGLLGGLDRSYVATLLGCSSPGEQILADLHALNGTESLVDGTCPLRCWLSNACTLSSSRTEGAVFQQAIAGLSSKVAKPPPVPEPASVADAPAPRPALPPPPARFVGRDAVADQLTAAVLREPAVQVVLLGPGGIGKSTLTLAVLHRPEVARRFAARRWFVRLDASRTAEALAIKLVDTLGFPPSSCPLPAVCAFLGAAPGVLALDNLETPWEGDLEATEALLGELAAVPGLVLVASLRGVNRPANVAWAETVEVKPLLSEAAADLFCAISRARRDDPALARVLAPLGGVPLAITLLAHVAERQDLARLVEAWAENHTALLTRKGTKPRRDTSWAVSMACSMKSPRMNDPARRLLGLLGRLPDGMAFRDVDALLPHEGMEGQRVLVEVGLAYEEERRLRVLAPVREYAREAVVPTEEELRRVMGHYAQLARELGPKAGREGGAEAIARLAPETANLDAMIREGLAESPAAGWVRAAVALTNFARISGHASSFPLETARKVARMIGETLSEAICIKNLGDIARHRMDHEEARRRYEEALPLYRRVGNVLGEASCIRGLGNIARHRMDHEEARRQYEEALLLFRQDGDALGEANCIQNLGEVALDRSDHEEAQRRYDEALPLYRWAGSLVGEANCIKGLGDIALARSGHEEARLQYEKALPLYRRGGDVQGEANCIQRLGDIAQAASDLVAASECYKTALALYTRIDQSYLIASTHRLLARIATEPNEKQRHVDTARALCAQIHRQDLVEALDAEFGPPR